MNETLEPTDWFHRAYENRKTIGLVLLILLPLIGGAAWWMNRKQHRFTDNLNQAETIALELTKSHKLFENPNGAKATKDLVAKLQQLAKNDGEIRQRMNGILAEIDLLQGNLTQPAPLTAIQQLAQASLPSFEAFSEMGCVAQKGRPREASELADKILKMNDIGTTPQVMAFTLLQKAALLRSLGKTEETKKTIAELRNVIKQSPDFLAHVQEEGITLLDFLEKK